MKNITNSRNLLYIAALLIFTGCGKLQGTVGPTMPSGGHTATSDSYQPVSRGSVWKYAYTQNGVTDTATVTMTGINVPYAGAAYYEAFTTFKNHKFSDFYNYLLSGNHVYKALTALKSDTTNLYFFNDTTALNNTWTAKVNNLGVLNGQQARYVGDIVEQNISLTVAGITYTGVTHSKVYLQYSLGDNNYTTAETYDYFIVKGIGTIEEFTSTASGSTSSQALINYTIK